MALDGMVSTTTFRADVMAEAASSPYAAATDLAELLVVRGVPFREAHGIVGEHVRRALAGEGALADLVGADDRLGPDAVALLAPGASVANRTSPGGGGPATVAAQLQRFRTRVAADRERASRRG